MAVKKTPYYKQAIVFIIYEDLISLYREKISGLPSYKERRHRRRVT